MFSLNGAVKYKYIPNYQDNTIMMKNFKDITVAVAGTGYCGLSIATLLFQLHHVTAVAVTPER